jgi:hypothetical protein
MDKGHKPSDRDVMRYSFTLRPVAVQVLHVKNFNDTSDQSADVSENWDM